MSLPFGEGDRVEVRGREYTVGEVVNPDCVDGVLHYKLEPVADDGPLARLEPVEDDDSDDVAVIAEYHAVTADDVDVLEGADAEVADSDP